MSAKRFLERVRQIINPQTDPVLMKSILRNLHLDQFKPSNDKYLEDFLIKIQHESLDMRPFINHLISYVLENKVFLKLLTYIDEQNLISTTELGKITPVLQLQLNLLCLFEAIMVTFLNSPTLANDLYQHIKSRRPLSSGNSYLTFLFGTPYKAGFFERLKLTSVEPVVTTDIFHRTMGDKKETPNDLQLFIKNQKLSGPNASLIGLAEVGDQDPRAISCWSLNVAEAVDQETKNPDSTLNGKMNANAGAGWIYALETQPTTSLWEHSEEAILPREIKLNEDSSYPLIPALKIKEFNQKVRKFDMGTDLMNSYITWNARFVTANYDPVFMLLKLFIPSVIGAETNIFANSRVLTLWLFGNLFMQEKTKQNPLFSCQRLTNAAAILAYWSQLNEQETDTILHNKEASKYAYRSIFGNHPHFNLFKIIVSFFSKGEQNRLMPASASLHAATTFMQ